MIRVRIECQYFQTLRARAHVVKCARRHVKHGSRLDGTRGSAHRRDASARQDVKKLNDAHVWVA